MKFSRSQKMVLGVAALVLALQLSLGSCLLDHEERALLNQLDEQVRGWVDVLVASQPDLKPSDARRRAQGLGAALLRHEDVPFCEIRNEQGELLFNGGIPDRQYLRRHTLRCPLSLPPAASGATSGPTDAPSDTLTLQIAVDGLHGTLMEARGIVILSGIVAVITALFFATLMVRHAFGTPLGRLLAKGRAIDLGHFDRPIDVAGADEIGQLENALDRIATQLHRLIPSERACAVPGVSEQTQDESLSALKRAYEKLEGVNRELNDFASVVAHDLKAPLRHIRALADWIVSDCGTDLHADQQEHIGLLVSQVGRMHHLIEGILQYSRVGRDDEAPTRVDLNDVVSEAIALVAAPDHIEIVVSGTLPALSLERTRILQVFENLLGNAVKFMDKPQGHIRIGCLKEDGYWTFSVADNGPGIEERAPQRIFRISQTGLPGAAGAGIGIGLAVVRKTIEMYGGRVWVESKPGQGSTFFFTLPTQQRQTQHDRLQASTAR